MKKTRKLSKSRTVERTRSIYKTRKSTPAERRLSDVWATINKNADGVTLSFLIEGGYLPNDKTIKLDDVNQTNRHSIVLPKTNLSVHHTKLKLTRGVTHTVKLWDGLTRTIKLPTSNLNIAYISDTHHADNPETTEHMMGVVKSTEPDYILCGGDWVIDDRGSNHGERWIRFIQDCLPIVNQNRIIPFLPPTIGNHDHVGSFREPKYDLNFTNGWYGYYKDVEYLHKVFPFENGLSDIGYGVVDLTDDISVFVTDFCTNDILANQFDWFQNEAQKRSHKRNIFVSHIQLFPSDRAVSVNQFLRNNYFPTIYDYFQFGLDGHDHSLSTTKPIISVSERTTGEGGVRFYGQGGMSDKWYDGSQAGAWYMDNVVLRQNHFHSINFDGGEFAISPIDRNGAALFTHVINR